MSIHRTAAQRDTNEGELVAAFERLGWLVVRHTVYDLDVSCRRCKAIHAVEVKTRAKRTNLTDSQRALIARGWPLHILFDVAGVERFHEIHAHFCGSMRGGRT